MTSPSTAFLFPVFVQLPKTFIKAVGFAATHGFSAWFKYVNWTPDITLTEFAATHGFSAWFKTMIVLLYTC
jgi:hypothetical protein